ncbi:hypothetical protein E4O04_09710 [Treponema sp. OMZ 799]|uniref:hypothetical protein n=1 Tax=Treponema sp. OMZ 799 TaxID=2563668 RepID=UPI0020A3B459|nr:hypothetical protein [Treponema sp. OMZ 799]UTC77079.1 hypothetical protein E4O04_03280 [Treponema sp. OMZ 799]UTC78264.1 hypothetical protein E4O04_09710 [Treponema sp. OMZ 799]
MKVFIPVKERDGFSVFAEGALIDMENTSRGDLYLSFSDSAILVLYYTYPNHRRLYILHTKGVGDKIQLPCTDTPACIIFRGMGKVFDVTKNAFYYLRKTTNEDYLFFPKEFYYEMGILADSKKLNRFKLNLLMKKYGLL